MQTNKLKRLNSRKRSISVGRGGKRGKTSGRGTKGQNARAGRKKRPELREIIMKLPKRRGFAFKSIGIKAVNINLSALNVFEKGANVTPANLIERGMISKKAADRGIKILAGGNLSRALNLRGFEVSDSAKELIVKAGGSVVNK